LKLGPKVPVHKDLFELAQIAESQKLSQSSGIVGTRMIGSPVAASTFLELLDQMWRHSVRILFKRLCNDFAQFELDLLYAFVHDSQGWREIEYVPDDPLQAIEDAPLSLRDELLEVIRGKWLPKQNFECVVRDEMGSEDPTYLSFGISLDPFR
jgi:hypothetical protein